MNSTSERADRNLGLAIALVLCLSLLPHIACAQPKQNKEQYRKIFTDALGRFLSPQKTNNICLPPMYFSGAQAIELNQRIIDALPNAPTGPAAQLKALEDVGLVTSTTMERTINNRTESFRSYRRTEKGDQYYSENRFCYAHAELNKITKWKGPAVFGDYKIAWVYYTIRVTNVADWVTTPAILAAFPAAKAAVQDEPDKVRQVLIDLSNEGWEVNEWSRVLQ
jgi:hypothetical protein